MGCLKVYPRPVLYLIYINDPIHCSTLLKFILFTDDINIFYSYFIQVNNLNTVFDTLNIELAKLSNWCKVNKLLLNVKKTNYIIFNSRHGEFGKRAVRVISSAGYCDNTTKLFQKHKLVKLHVLDIHKLQIANFGCNYHIMHALNLIFSEDLSLSPYTITIQGSFI